MGVDIRNMRVDVYASYRPTVVRLLYRNGHNVSPRLVMSQQLLLYMELLHDEDVSVEFHYLSILNFGLWTCETSIVSLTVTFES